MNSALHFLQCRNLAYLSHKNGCHHICAMQNVRIAIARSVELRAESQRLISEVLETIDTLRDLLKATHEQLSRRAALNRNPNQFPVVTRPKTTNEKRSKSIPG